MELVHYVKDDDAKTAKGMEEKLLKLPIDSGVLFVGVAIDPAKSPTQFIVRVGCSRDVDPRMIPTLVQVTLREEVQSGKAVAVETYMGKIR